MFIYLRVIGVLITAFLIGFNVFLVVMLDRNSQDEWVDFVPWAVCVMLIFFALHYLTLTSFGFVKREGQLTALPKYLRSFPYVYLFASSLFLGVRFNDMQQALKLLRPLSYEEKVEIMSTDLGLPEKLRLLALENEFSSRWGVKWEFQSKFNTIRIKNARHLDDFYDAFGLNAKVTGELQKVNSTYFDGNIEIVLPLGSKISVPLSDRKVIGFHRKAGVVVLQWRHPNQGLRYESVSFLDPKSSFEGIPLIESSDEKYFADVRMLFKVDGVDLAMIFWKRNNGSFVSLGQAIIPFSNYYNSKKRTEIANMLWENSIFEFDIIEHSNDRPAAATTVTVAFK